MCLFVKCKRIWYIKVKNQQTVCVFSKILHFIVYLPLLKNLISWSDFLSRYISQNNGCHTLCYNYYNLSTNYLFQTRFSSFFFFFCFGFFLCFFPFFSLLNYLVWLYLSTILFCLIVDNVWALGNDSFCES